MCPTALTWEKQLTSTRVELGPKTFIFSIQREFVFKLCGILINNVD